MTKECKTCGQQFSKPVHCSLKRWHTVRKYCSPACSPTVLQNGNTPWNKDKKTGQLVWNKGKTFQQMVANTYGFKKGQTPWNKGKSHSEETKAKIRLARSKQTNLARKERHGSWKGGITPLLKAVRNLDRYIQWRTDVFIRDNRTCVQCRSIDEIEADHIIPLSALLKIFEIETADEARMCDFLWDVANGRTLCHECHTQTKTYAANAKKHPAYALSAN